MQIRADLAPTCAQGRHFLTKPARIRDKESKIWSNMGPRQTFPDQGRHFRTKPGRIKKNRTKLDQNPLHALTRFWTNFFGRYTVLDQFFWSIHALTRNGFFTNRKRRDFFQERSHLKRFNRTNLHLKCIFSRMFTCGAYFFTKWCVPRPPNRHSRLMQPWQTVPNPDFRQGLSRRACLRLTCCCATCRVGL